MRKLEEWFAAELVVVGVHAGKFIAERVTENIRQAVLRLGVDHPVVNDRQYRTWRSYAINAWPTLTLIDPEGRVVGQQAGELPAESLAPAVERVIEAAAARGVLDRTVRTFAPEHLEGGRPFLFPAKVAADPGGERLFVADTGNQRVVVVRLDEGGQGGVAEAVIGSGEGGLADGAYDEAAFDHPHGLAIDGDRLYVADTGNHAVRVVDLATERVDTLLGSGEQARRFNVPGRGREVALNSPWDLLVLDGALYIAMAGSHQLWRADLSTLECAPWAGSGAEALFDAPLLGAALAQPSGLAAAGGKLFFADSESSAIRRADLAPGGSVGTVVGTGLFDFGDQDGAGDEVRLQHPLALAWRDGRLLVADSYNNKVKIVDPTDRTATSWLGGAGELWEPGGLAVAGGRLYIADTNHHRVVVASLAGAEMEALVVRGV